LLAFGQTFPRLAAFGGTKVHWTFVCSASLCGKTHEIGPDALG
jgi:hypothetical protein